MPLAGLNTGQWRRFFAPFFLPSRNGTQMNAPETFRSVNHITVPQAVTKVARPAPGHRIGCPVLKRGKEGADLCSRRCLPG